MFSGETVSFAVASQIVWLLVRQNWSSAQNFFSLPSRHLVATLWLVLARCRSMITHWVTHYILVVGMLLFCGLSVARYFIWEKKIVLHLDSMDLNEVSKVHVCSQEHQDIENFHWNPDESVPLLYHLFNINSLCKEIPHNPGKISPKNITRISLSARLSAVHLSFKLPEQIPNTNKSGSVDQIVKLKIEKLRTFSAEVDIKLRFQALKTWQECKSVVWCRGPRKCC